MQAKTSVLKLGLRPFYTALKNMLQLLSSLDIYLRSMSEVVLSSANGTAAVKYPVEAILFKNAR